MAKENEEILKQTVKEEVWKHLRNYFRMSRPGFEITSNADVLNHGIGEFCLTTDTAQGMQFYKQGNMKTKSNKSTEMYAGFDSSRDDLAVGIHAENGVIYIRAVNGDLVLQGKNVKIDANDPQGTVSINANKEIYTQAPKFQAQTTNFTVGSKKNFHIFAGDVKLHSEYVPAELSTGDDYVLNDSLSSKALNVSDIWKDASIWS